MYVCLNLDLNQVKERARLLAFQQPVVTSSTGTCSGVNESFRAAPVDLTDWSDTCDTVKTELVNRGLYQVTPVFTFIHERVNLRLDALHSCFGP